MYEAEKVKSHKLTKLVKMKGMLRLWLLILLFISTHFAKKINVNLSCITEPRLSMVNLVKVRFIHFHEPNLH